MIRSESFTIFFVSELESSTILNLITFLLIILTFQLTEI